MFKTSKTEDLFGRTWTSNTVGNSDNGSHRTTESPEGFMFLNRQDSGGPSGPNVCDGGKSQAFWNRLPVPASTSTYLMK